MRRLTFHCFEAYLGRIDDVRRCAIWTQNPREIGFDLSKLVPIDLARTPNAANVGTIEWDEVQIDDHNEASGATWPVPPRPGLTTLGPAWPFERTLASVWLEERYVNALRDMGCHLVSPQKYYKAQDYEFISILEVRDRKDGPDEIVRYNPHHCKLDAEGNAIIFERGHSGDGDPNPLYKKLGLGDLKKPSSCHPELGTLISKQLREGSVFLEASYEKMVELNGPKVPHSEGI